MNTPDSFFTLPRTKQGFPPLTPAQRSELAGLERLRERERCDCGMVIKGRVHNCKAQGGKLLKSTRYTY